MDDHQPENRRRRTRRWAGAAGLLAAGALAGGVLAGTLSASAADNGSTTSTTGTSSTASAPPGYGPRSGGPHGAMGGSTPVRSDEKALSASDAAKVEAAALKAVPGGTVYRVETDAGDGVYEAHMTRPDGTVVTVKLDKNFTVTKVEAGMGLGDPAPAGGPGHGSTGDAGTGSA